ncbi:MAG: TlpA family protein disulfide reductase [Spirochaetaceae bacterium]|jgi:thiol-disulfide isomerase/thioredoxin|nr:TlpA family protein disulfide reductase [Spirochaetaceae bacterium]
MKNIKHNLKQARSMNRLLITTVLGIFAASVPLFAQTGVPENVKNSFAKAGLPLLNEARDTKNFTLKTLDGKQLSLDGLRGKVVFLNFWATWCGPCRQEMPSMEALYQRFKNSGLEFAAVDIMEKEPDVGAYIKRNNLNFPVALDLDGNVSKNYRIQAVPATFIINRNGKIILSTVGARNWNIPAIISAFEALLNSGI